MSYQKNSKICGFDTVELTNSGNIIVIGTSRISGSELQDSLNDVISQVSSKKSNFYFYDVLITPDDAVASDEEQVKWMLIFKLKPSSEIMKSRSFFKKTDIQNAALEIEKSEGENAHYLRSYNVGFTKWLLLLFEKYTDEYLNYNYRLND